MTTTAPRHPPETATTTARRTPSRVRVRDRWRSRISTVRRSRERGSVTLEWMILFPLVLLVLLLGMQAALYYQARTLAVAAAEEGARAAAGERARATDGTLSATDLITQAGGEQMLPDYRIRAERTGTTATVEVTATSPSIIPGWRITLHQICSRPVEHLTR